MYSPSAGRVKPERQGIRQLVRMNGVRVFVRSPKSSVESAATVN